MWQYTKETPQTYFPYYKNAIQTPTSPLSNALSVYQSQFKLDFLILFNAETHSSNFIFIALFQNQTVITCRIPGVESKTTTYVETPMYGMGRNREYKGGKLSLKRNKQGLGTQ